MGTEHESERLGALGSTCIKTMSVTIMHVPEWSTGLSHADDDFHPFVPRLLRLEAGRVRVTDVCVPHLVYGWGGFASRFSAVDSAGGLYFLLALSTQTSALRTAWSCLTEARYR